uniref:Poly(A) polymerase n=1 Tax=Oreochromis niloticus TaxID=8128 RepID=I3IXK7_ORENI
HFPFNPNRSQTPTWSNMPKTYGLTGPISEDLPEEENLIQTRKLLDTMKSYNVYENNLEFEHRCCTYFFPALFNVNVPEVVTEKVGGKIFPFGSYHLGVHSKGADIDALCVGPGFLERKAFFTSFFAKLKAQKEVKDIQAIEEAYVPVITLSWEGIQIDLVFALLSRRSVPDNLDLLNNSIVKDIDIRCVRSFNGYRVTEQILRLVPNVLNFRVALRAIKLWAKQRNIYSNKLGFLGGVSWAIMVARICQVYPNATTSTLVIKFFKIFSMWVWPIPIRLIEVEKCNYNLPFWDPKVNQSDRCHLMPIITPAYPQQNTSVNVSRSTLAILNEEIHRGHAICQEIEQKKAKWSELFEQTDFFQKYQYVLRHVKMKIDIATHRTQLVGLVESKIRLLVSTLERNELVSLAHVHPHAFPGHRKANKKDGQSTMWLIGLVLNVKDSERCKINLECSFETFTNIINSLARSSDIYDEGMSLSVACLRREDLIYEPQQRAPQPSETLPPCHVSPVSADKQGTKKRELLHRSETPSKKIKDDKVCSIIHPNCMS